MTTCSRFMHFLHDHGRHALIAYFVSNDALNCAISIDSLPLHSGDEMYMHMKYFLASSFSDIHADVISVGIQFRVDRVLHFFFCRKLEIVIHVTFGNDECMPLAHGASIPYRKSVLVLIKNVLCRDRTKRARTQVFTFPMIYFRLQLYQFPGSIVSCDVPASMAVFPQSKENSHDEACSDGAPHMRCNYGPRMKLLFSCVRKHAT